MLYFGVAGEAQEGEVLGIFYCRKFRSAFTLKRDLEFVKRSGDLEEDEDEDVSLPTPRKRSTTTLACMTRSAFFVRK